MGEGTGPLGARTAEAAAAERSASYAAEMRAAAAAAAELAAAWSADPFAAAAVIRYRQAQERAEAPAPDSCAVLEGMTASYAAYAERKAADQQAVCRFELAEQAYAEALRRLGSYAEALRRLGSEA